MIYIAGRMQGIPEFNFPAFFEAEEELMMQGLAVFNPAREDGIDTKGLAGVLSEIPDFCLKEAMKRNCKVITECTEIYMLVGWEYSKGATIEHQLAVYLGLTIKYQGA